MATLFPGLSLFFASGLSSPGLLGCLALCLRYADLLYLWLCAHSLLDQGFVGFLPVLRPPACSGSASSGGFSSHLWFTPFAMGSPLRDRGYFVLDRNEGLVFFPFPLGCFFMLSLPLGMKSPYGSAVGWARPPLDVGAAPFLLLVGLRTSV